MFLMPLNPFIKGGVDVPVVDGGTGASTAAGARTNLDTMDEAEHDLLDHTGLTGVGDLTVAAHPSLDHSSIPMSLLNVGSATSAVATGDSAADVVLTGLSGTPTAGTVRVVLTYLSLTAPTS
jgi:hypothetical protein